MVKRLAWAQSWQEIGPRICGSGGGSGGGLTLPARFCSRKNLITAASGAGCEREEKAQSDKGASTTHSCKRNSRSLLRSAYIKAAAGVPAKEVQVNTSDRRLTGKKRCSAAMG